KIGGKSVFPYQPDGIWDLPYNDETWVESKGDERYRRGLYTFARRTAPYPSMLTFDAPSREFCTVRRVRTNTPLQALTTLNDPAYFEAAKALAARILKEGGPDTRSRAEHGFRLCTAHKPSPTEVDRLVSWVEREKQMQAAAADPELAVWTVVSNILLNLDETL